MNFQSELNSEHNPDESHDVDSGITIDWQFDTIRVVVVPDSE